DDAVCVVLRGHGSQNRVGVEIEYHNRSGAVANESPSEFRNHCNAMVMLLAGNVRNRFPRRRVDDHHVCASRNVEMVTLFINCDVVESAFAANMKRLFDSPFVLSKSVLAKSERSCHD